jgi:tripartite-type tricarboxylate transporter receptor subunit TctC
MPIMNAVNRTLVLAVLAGAVWLPAAHAQTYPTKPIRLVVSFPPGGLADIIARLLAQPLGAALGQSVVVENRPGGGTVIATELVARAPADGHTLLLAGFPFVANAALRSDLPYDTQKDFAAVARIESSAWMVAIHPSLPVKSVKELIAFARGRPGQLTYAANPAGSGAHLVGEMLKLATKINIVDVPYQGEVPAMIAAIGGHADIVVSHVPTLMPQLASGKLRVLAVSSRTRLDRPFNDVPTLAESAIPDFELAGTQGLVVPAATPKAVISRLSAEIGRAMALPAIHDNLVRQGLHPAPMDSAEYGAFLRSEFLKLQKMFRAANIKPS